MDETPHYSVLLVQLSSRIIHPHLYNSKAGVNIYLNEETDARCASTTLSGPASFSYPISTSSLGCPLPPTLSYGLPIWWSSSSVSHLWWRTKVSPLVAFLFWAHFWWLEGFTSGGLFFCVSPLVDSFPGSLLVARGLHLWWPLLLHFTSGGALRFHLWWPSYSGLTSGGSRASPLVASSSAFHISWFALRFTPGGLFSGLTSGGSC